MNKNLKLSQNIQIDQNMFLKKEYRSISPKS